MSILINLEHTLEEANLILAALADRPFKEVNDLINKIRANATQQLSVAQVPAPATDPVSEAASDVSVL